MNNGITNLRKRAYQSEKVIRWGMALQLEEPAADEIVKVMKNTFLGNVVNIEASRYDYHWFDAFDINYEYNDWVKGSSDYCIEIQQQNGENQYLYVEIKLKGTEYRKTIFGGQTQEGTRITKYGCTSFYLDIIPVYSNITKFIDKFNIKHESFILAFINNENLSDVNVISYARLKRIIENGWRGIPLCEYEEGYGKKTYLIPKDATTKLTEITHMNFLRMSTNRLELP